MPLTVLRGHYYRFSPESLLNSWCKHTGINPGPILEKNSRECLALNPQRFYLDTILLTTRLTANIIQVEIFSQLFNKAASGSINKKSSILLFTEENKGP